MATTTGDFWKNLEMVMPPVAAPAIPAPATDEVQPPESEPLSYAHNSPLEPDNFIFTVPETGGTLFTGTALTVNDMKRTIRLEHLIYATHKVTGKVYFCIKLSDGNYINILNKDIIKAIFTNTMGPDKTPLPNRTPLLAKTLIPINRIQVTEKDTNRAVSVGYLPDDHIVAMEEFNRSNNKKRSEKRALGKQAAASGGGENSAPSSKRDKKKQDKKHKKKLASKKEKKREKKKKDKKKKGKSNSEEDEESSAASSDEESASDRSSSSSSSSSPSSASSSGEEDEEEEDSSSSSSGSSSSSASVDNKKRKKNKEKKKKTPKDAPHSAAIKHQSSKKRPLPPSSTKTSSEGPTKKPRIDGPPVPPQPSASASSKRSAPASAPVFKKPATLPAAAGPKKSVLAEEPTAAAAGPKKSERTFRVAIPYSLSSATFATAVPEFEKPGYSADTTMTLMNWITLMAATYVSDGEGDTPRSSRMQQIFGDYQANPDYYAPINFENALYRIMANPDLWFAARAQSHFFQQNIALAQRITNRGLDLFRAETEKYNQGEPLSKNMLMTTTKVSANAAAGKGAVPAAAAAGSKKPHSVASAIATVSVSKK